MELKQSRQHFWTKPVVNSTKNCSNLLRHLETKALQGGVGVEKLFLFQSFQSQKWCVPERYDLSPGSLLTRLFQRFVCLFVLQNRQSTYPFGSSNSRVFLVRSRGAWENLKVAIVRRKNPTCTPLCLSCHVDWKVALCLFRTMKNIVYFSFNFDF